ncbi:MAG: hypothetical protein NDI61_13030 [Bdellovibrionaceae bacterium]|nr:hypothetical protein [Pseudobdellovibrionaceae bacterium]
MFTKLNQVRKSQDEKHLRAVHAQTCEAVERLKSCEAELIRCLQEVDRFLVHRFLGYNSLFQYSLHALKLSEAQSYAYITVARKAQDLPQLQEAITKGDLTVSKAVRITSVINEANQQKWIGLALELPKRDLEREVARENPRAARPEQARFLDAHTLELSTPLSEANYKLGRGKKCSARLRPGKELPSRTKCITEITATVRLSFPTAAGVIRRFGPSSTTSNLGLKEVPMPLRTS